MENQSQQPQTQEKPKKSVWKKWWFWLIIILISFFIFFDHTAKVNYCKDECISCDKGGWEMKRTTNIYSCTMLRVKGEYQTKKDCIEDCLLITDWEEVKY